MVWVRVRSCVWCKNRSQLALGKSAGTGEHKKNPEGGHLLGAIGHTGVPGVSRASILTQHLRKCAGKIFPILSRWSTAASQTDVLLFFFFVGSISVFPFRFLSKSHTHTEFCTDGKVLIALLPSQRRKRRYLYINYYASLPFDYSFASVRDEVLQRALQTSLLLFDPSQQRPAASLAPY